MLDYAEKGLLEYVMTDAALVRAGNTHLDEFTMRYFRKKLERINREQDIREDDNEKVNRVRQFLEALVG